MRRILLLLSLMVGACGLLGHTVGAVSLQLAPLDVKTTLKKDENQKGFLDIANPSSVPVTVNTSVQAFRQINSKGDLEFYDDPKIRAGVLLDLDKITIEPQGVFRMYYVISSTKLPEGDISAVIFFTSSGNEAAGVNSAVRVGTLLHITNGQPGERQAEITGLSLPFWQLSSQVQGDYTVKNTSDPTKSGGFFPKVEVKVAPFIATQTVEASLVFPGIERQNTIAIPTTGFGLYRVDVSYGTSTRSSLVFIAAPWHLVLLALLIGGSLWFWWRWRISKKPTKLLRKNLRT